MAPKYVGAMLYIVGTNYEIVHLLVLHELFWKVAGSIPDDVIGIFS
jgi:hypothetical protein